MIMIQERFKKATVLVLFAPLCAGVGSWLIFQAHLVVEPNPITAIAVIETGVGAFIFCLAFLFFFSSLGVFGSRNNQEAEKWVLWLGRWKPRWEYRPQSSTSRDDYRLYALAALLAIFLLAILPIPGIGEDRQFPLNQFYGFFGSLWYFYAFSIGIAGLILLYNRRIDGYVLSLMLIFIVIGTNVTDVMALKPSAQRTFRTSILELATLLPSVLLAGVSCRTLRPEVSR